MSWSETTLGSHIDLISGPAFKSRLFTEDTSDVPLVKGENIGQGMILWDKSKYWPRSDACEHEKYKLQTGDVVLAMDRPWVSVGLKYAVINERDPEALLVQRVARIRGINGLHPKFLRYVISSPQFSGYVKNIQGGTNVPHISGDQIRAFRFAMPSMGDQESIASILSAYDDLIENNRRRIQLLEQATRLLYKEWFIHLRFPGHDRSAGKPIGTAKSCPKGVSAKDGANQHVKIKDGVPEGWEKKPLGELLTLQRGFDLPVRKRKEGYFPIYASTGINGYHVEAKVKGPGVVTGRSGSLGKVMFVSEDFWPLNTTLWVKEFILIGPHFAAHLLENMQLGQYNGGAAVPTLNRNDVHRVEVLYPPPLLLKMFEDYAKDVIQQIDVLESTIGKLESARNLLLPRLMNGEIAV